MGGDDYLRIFSFNNPAKPTMVSETPMIGAQGLAVANGWVFAGSCCAGLSRFTTSDPGKPIETHQVTTPSIERVVPFSVDGHLYSFALAGTDNNQDKLIVLDGDNPTTVKADSEARYPGDPLGVFDQNNTNLVVLPGAAHEALVYIVGVSIPGGNPGVRVYSVDFSIPAAVKLNYTRQKDLGLDSFRNTNTLALSGHYLLIPNQNTGVKVVDLDLSNISNPREVAQFGNRPFALGALGNKAYVFSDDNRLRVYDLSQLGSPSPVFAELGAIDWRRQFNWPNQINLKGFGAVTYAYITTGNQVIVMDVTDLAAMRILAYDNKQNAWINSGVNIGNFFLASESNLGLYSYWAPPQTQAKLSQTTDVLDSSAVDGVQYHLNAVPTNPITLLHMPLYTGNVSATFPSGLQGTRHTFEVSARDAATDRSVTSFGAGTYTVTVQYTDADIAGLSENSLALYYWDGAAWHKDYSSLVDATQNKVSAAPNHFSMWTLAGMADTTGPGGALVINSGANYSNTQGVTLTLSGLGADADRVRFKEDCAGCAWSSWSNAFDPSFTFTLSTVDGLKTVAAEIFDTANNMSQAQDTITLDTTAPTGGLYINGGLALTASPSVSLFLTFTEAGSGVSQYQVASNSSMSGATWTAFANPISFSMPGGDGVKTVYIKVKDNAGNVSAVISDTITLDSTAPTGSIVITAGSQAYFTHQVVLTLSASDEISPAADLQMQVSNDAAFSGASWQTYQTSLVWGIDPGAGMRTVYVRFRDSAGNISTYQSQATVRVFTFLPQVRR